MTIEKPTFFAQLKQRHVFRVAAMYAVTAWLLVQVGSSTFEPLGFPAWSQRALIIVLATGLPIALVLAWIFDVTPEGVVKGMATPSDRLSRGRKLDIVIIVALLAALVVTFVWRREPASVPTVAQESSIAVLPFVAMSEDASLRHLGEGLSEQITNELAGPGRSELRVASRTSAFEQAGKGAVAIAHTLGVSYVLEGSVRPAGDTVRVTAQLVQGHDGVHAWSNTYDVVENDAAEWDETAVMIALTAASYLALEHGLQLARTFTTNAEAYEHYAAAQRLGWQINTGGSQTPKLFVQMLEEVDRAIALDPQFMPAHLGRASLFLDQFAGAACGSRCFVEARKSIDSALALKPDDPNALRRLGGVQLFYELDPAAAEATFERVRQIDPTNGSLNGSFALLAMFRGNAKEAHDYWVRQLEVTPYVASHHIFYALVLRALGDRDGQERELRSAIRLTPRGGFMHVESTLLHIDMLIQRGEIDRARAEFAPVWADYRYAHPERFGRELGHLGYDSEARELAARLSQGSGVDPWDAFFAYYGLGSYDDALVWLRRVVDNRWYAALCAVRLPNQFPGLQEQPGYAELLKYLDSIQRSR